jgi:multiple sugar transport system substrate-binding protein
MAAVTVTNSKFKIQNAKLAACLFLHFAFCILSFGCAARTSDSRDTVEFWGLGREGEVVAEMIPEFERRNPGIHIVVQQIPWTAAHEKLLTAYVGDATPDLAQMGNTWIPEFVAVHALDELSDLARNLDQRDYFGGIWATNVVGRGLYGIPWYVDTRVLFYNTEALARAGYPRGPRTWAELIDAMTKLQREKVTRYGILMPINEWEPVVQLALTNRSTLLDPSGARGAFEQREFAEAFSFYVDMFHRGFAPAISNTQVANLYDDFSRGEFAMYVTGPWNVGEFKRRLPARMQGKWGTAPLPARDAARPGISMAGGSSLVVFRASRHKAAAKKFVEFLSQPAQQIRFYELTGDLPARRSAWQAPALAQNPYFPAFREQLERVESLPKVPEWEQIATEVFAHGERAVRNASTIPAALADLDRRADQLLEKRRWMLARAR